MISHMNIISNVLALSTYESAARSELGVKSEATLGLLPFSHIYCLVTVSMCSTFRGDEIIVLPKFSMKTLLAAIQRFRISRLALVCIFLIYFVVSFIYFLA